MSDEEESYSYEDEQWKPEYNALKDILNNQKSELKKLKKTNSKITKPAVKKDVVRTVTIDGKSYPAIIGGSGTIKYLDKGKLKTVRDKVLYQRFLQDDPLPGDGYARYKQKTKMPATTTSGSYKVPVSNTQTFRQLLAATVVREAWEEVKTLLPPDRQLILSVYNAALKGLINDIIMESGLSPTPANAEALHEYVSQQLKNKKWCTKIKESFKSRITDFAENA